MRDSLQMDGPWRFLPDPKADGDSLGFWKPEYDARLWCEVAVPSCFDTGHPELASYEGLCWYRRAFRVPPGVETPPRGSAIRGRKTTARKCGSTTSFLGENLDGFLPFEFEIQNLVRWDGENLLAVSVDNAHHEGDVPGMHVGWRGYGGILREVRVYATDLLHLEEVRALATPGAPAPCTSAVESSGAEIVTETGSESAARSPRFQPGCSGSRSFRSLLEPRRPRRGWKGRRTRRSAMRVRRAGRRTGVPPACAQRAAQCDPLRP